MLKKLSIIVPVYNEEETVAGILQRVKEVQLPEGTEKEVVVIDDGSTDSTIIRIKNQESRIKNLTLCRHKTNQGKGSAVRTGIKIAAGDYIVIQDADLEYNPDDIPRLLKPVLAGEAGVVYGTRLDRLPNLRKEERTLRFLLHFFGNRFLSLITSLLYGQWLTDMETCYKLFPRKAVLSMKLKARGFEFEPEITAKLLKRGYKIKEVSIVTSPRGYAEGKKLNTFRDGLKALWTLLRHKF